LVLLMHVNRINVKIASRAELREHDT